MIWYLGVKRIGYFMACPSSNSSQNDQVPETSRTSDVNTILADQMDPNGTTKTFTTGVDDEPLEAPC